MHVRSFGSWLLALSFITACGGSSAPSGGEQSTGSGSGTGTQQEPPQAPAEARELVPASGAQSLPNPAADKLLTGFVFANEGSHDVTITQLAVTLGDGSIIHAGAGVVLQQGGGTVTWAFEQFTPRAVSSLDFVVEGSTEKLIVTGSDMTGHFP